MGCLCVSGFFRWRWLYYSFMFVYGLMCLWDKPWLWDIRHCWFHYPRHPVPQGVWWYYMVELSFYWSLAISQFFDVKRKDFWEMFIHHAITILLMSMSWTCNLTRVGTLVLVIHDCADILLEVSLSLTPLIRSLKSGPQQCPALRNWIIKVFHTFARLYFYFWRVWQFRMTHHMKAAL